MPATSASNRSSFMSMQMFLFRTFLNKNYTWYSIIRSRLTDTKQQKTDHTFSKILKYPDLINSLGLATPTHEKSHSIDRPKRPKQRYEIDHEALPCSKKSCQPTSPAIATRPASRHVQGTNKEHHTKSTAEQVARLHSHGPASDRYMPACISCLLIRHPDQSTSRIGMYRYYTTVVVGRCF